MRYPHLPLGARFEYEGKVYVKTGPIAATCEDGQQRMIPRYAILKSLDGHSAPPPPPPSRKWDEARVLQAFETYHAVCASLVSGHPDSEAALSAAKQAFLASLEGEMSAAGRAMPRPE